MEMETELKEANKQLEIDKSYLRMALIEAERSVALRLKVGAIIVKNDRIISNGFNHQPSYMSQVCEIVKRENNRTPFFNDEKEWEYLRQFKLSELQSKPTVKHAEVSALSKVKHNDSCEGATIYISHEPCIDCSKKLIEAKIKRVVYNKPYRLHDGIELLKKANIEVEQIDL